MGVDEKAYLNRGDTDHSVSQNAEFTPSLYSGQALSREILRLRLRMTRRRAPSE